MARADSSGIVIEYEASCAIEARADKCLAENSDDLSARYGARKPYFANGIRFCPAESGIFTDAAGERIDADHYGASPLVHDASKAIEREILNGCGEGRHIRSERRWSLPLLPLAE